MSSIQSDEQHEHVEFLQYQRVANVQHQIFQIRVLVKPLAEHGCESFFILVLIFFCCCLDFVVECSVSVSCGQPTLDLVCDVNINCTRKSSNFKMEFSCNILLICGIWKSQLHRNGLWNSGWEGLRGGRNVGGCCQRRQTPSYKMNQFWGSNVLHGDDSEHPVLYT